MTDEKGRSDQGARDPTLPSSALIPADDPTQTRAPPAEPAPQRIGPYKVLRQLGEGGFGVVYLAEQQEPTRRRVAVKIIKPGMDSKAVIARFDAERQALALMNHPNVAGIFDAGATDQGRPYFVMEHVPGVPITEHCDRHRLSVEQRLELFTQVCEAVQHAHQKGIIHRDIKPTNILVAIQDGKVVPKVIDFGVAKALSQPLTERTIFTEQGQLIGTPEYISPEQAEMTAQDIDTRSDIYSLGVLLYELLTGALPFGRASLRRAALAEIQRIIREVEPPKPSTKLSTMISTGAEDPTTAARKRHVDPRTLTRMLRGDLDWITMKALEKDRTRRYATASDLAADVQRHLRHEPVVAGPPSAAYRIRKFVRRNRGAVAAGGVIALVLLAATAVSIGFALSEAEQRRLAEAAERDQARARQEAEQARAGEEKQRKLAEQREKEATEARELAQQRADQLETVTDFQASMLSEVDAEQMGRGIFADLRDAIREALEARSASPADIREALASFDTSLRGANATNLALKVIDEHVLSRAVRTIEKDFADQPLVEAALRQTVADTYRALGLYPEAVPQQERALEVRRRELGDDHPDTLSSMNEMGDLLTSMGKLQEAQPYFREALEARRCVLGDDHPDTLYSIHNMAVLLQRMGKLEEAEPYCREALEGCRRVLGDDHPDTLISIANMGALLRSMGKLEEAEVYWREALEGHRRVLGDNHPHTLNSIDNMGALLWAMGKLEEAEAYWREALDGFRRVLGDDHPLTLTSIGNMGSLLQSMGKLEEAQAYRAEALEGNRRVLGDDHPDTLISVNNMGSLLKSMGKLQEAEPYFREALEGFRRVLGDDHPHTLGSIGNMGNLLEAMGKLEDAEAYQAEALEGSRRVLGDDHPDTLISISNMGRLLKSMGKLQEAEAYLREVLEGRRRVLGDDHPDTLASIANMGVLLQSMGKLQEAEALFAEAVDGAKQSLPEGHWRRGAFLCNHGKCLTKLKRYADAETALLEAYEILETALGAEDKQTVEVIQRLADLYDAWDKPEQAAEWRAKLPTTQPAAPATQEAPSD